LKKNKNITFIFPLYNEKDRIHKFIYFYKWSKKNIRLKTKYIFTVNGSTDNTYKLLKKIYNKPDIKVIKSKSRKRGDGINKALKLINNSLIAICAIDNAWDFYFYTKAINLIENSNFDVVLGSKNLKKSIVHTNIYRKIFSKLSGYYCRIMFGNVMKYDTQCVKVFRSNMNFFNNLSSYNYFAETEFYLRASSEKKKIKHIPIKVFNDTKGSKVKIKYILEFLKESIDFKLKNFVNVKNN
jgi:cellulose synthase/poly-beta-1,6-N-acetylglucosamine synthase-like glycosyltransferase|tara:strand:- start:1511 stop:2230 length:720 start_codon:yes stop_codon:yes gene_type:complete